MINRTKCTPRVVILSGWVENARRQEEFLLLCCYRFTTAGINRKKEKMSFESELSMSEREKPYKSFWICVKEVNDILKVWQESKELHPLTKLKCSQRTDETTYFPSWEALTGSGNSEKGGATQSYCSVTFPDEGGGTWLYAKEIFTFGLSQRTPGQDEKQTKREITVRNGLPSESSWNAYQVLGV